MVMIRKKGKAAEISKSVMKQKGIETPKASKNKDIKMQTPYLQH